VSRSALKLGIDLGTSAVKAAVIDSSGNVLASGESAYPTYSELPGQAEQEPNRWLQGAAMAVGNLDGQLGSAWRARSVSIGLAGQLPTLVCLDESAPLGRAIAWSDNRADVWAAGRLDQERRHQFYRATGMPIDGRYLAPMFQFHWRNRQASVMRILSAKDFLCFTLTGRAVTDPSTAAGYGVYGIAEGRWDPLLCAFWGLDPKLLPDIGAANALAGPLSAAGARLLGLPEGLPVSIGAADSVAGALAMGSMEEGSLSIAMGSSTVIIAAVQCLLLDPAARYLLTPHALDGWYGREMDLLATGTGFSWLCHLLSWSAEQFETQVLRSPPGACDVCFSPYLASGEQGVLWNPALRGVIHGLTLQHDPADIARAYLEGVFFEVRRCIEVLEEAKTAPIHRVVLAGKAAGNAGIMGILANVLGRPVQSFVHPSPSAIGAAMLAAGEGIEHSGVLSSQIAGRAEPGATADVYDRLYRRYLGLFPRIAQAPENPEIG
jgi:sugar (pentulose or hexulose) kinase